MSIRIEEELLFAITIFLIKSKKAIKMFCRHIPYKIFFAIFFLCFSSLQIVWRNKNLILFWIPGSKAIISHEILDELAEKHQIHTLGPEPFIGI